MQGEHTRDGTHERFRSCDSIGCSLHVDFGSRVVRAQPERFRAAQTASTGRRGELQKLCAVQMIDVRIPTTAAQAASAVPV
jgi:hypothetical protein